MPESYTDPVPASRGWRSIKATNFRAANGSGPARAFCDLRMETEVGEIKIHGFTVIQEGRKEPWVGFPRKAGKKDGKWFPVFEADGELRRLIVAAVLDAYNAMGKRG